jgi:hypothetical protein
MTQMSAPPTPAESRQSARRRSLAFFALVLLVAVVAGIVELSLTVWDTVGPQAAAGRAASMGGLPPVDPQPSPAPTGGTVPFGTGPGTAPGTIGTPSSPASTPAPTPVPVPSPPAPVGAFLHQNTSTITGGSPVICNDTTSPVTCGAVFNVSNARPGSSTSATVEIQTEASAPRSVFQLSLVSVTVSPSSSPLCDDLRLQVVDSEPTPRVLYAGALSAMPSMQIVDDAADATWPAGGYGRYSFAIGLPTSSGNADQSAACSAGIRWTQSPA